MAGLALRVPEGAARAARARARAVGAVRCSRSAGSRRWCRPCWCASSALFGTGLLPDTEQQIYRVPEDELYLAGTSEVPLASLHAGRDPRPRATCRSATPASPPASGARPAPRARTPRASSACTSSTRSRCSAFVEPERVGRGARAAARDRGGASSRRSEIPYRVVNIAANDLGELGREEVRPRGVAARARAATASSPPARTRPTSRPAGSTCATARARARRRATCTR